MRLFYIDKPGCHHITEIMPGIKATYQMEAEFYPYLFVDFMPHANDRPEGIILQAGNEIIKKDMSLDTKEDVEKLRKLIWKYVKKYHNPKDITKPCGCIQNFKDYTTFNVTQGWANKIRNLKCDECCLTEGIKEKPQVTDYLVKHWAYRDPTDDRINRDICKKIRGEECGNNYPSGSAEFRRCVEEVNHVCNTGYPPTNTKEGKCPTFEEKQEYNPYTRATNALVNATRGQIYKDLTKPEKDGRLFELKDNLKVDKRDLDNIFTAGLYQHTGNRAGNKSRNIIHAKSDNELTLLEGFNKSKKKVHELPLEKIILNICIVLTCLTIIAIIVGWDSDSIY